MTAVEASNRLSVSEEPADEGTIRAGTEIFPVAGRIRPESLGIRGNPVRFRSDLFGFVLILAVQNRIPTGPVRILTGRVRSGGVGCAVDLGAAFLFGTGVWLH